MQSLSENFNSIKVRLELNHLMVLAFLLSNFNSIKVRLEQLILVLSNSSEEFQFHKGAIRTFILVALEK